MLLKLYYEYVTLKLVHYQFFRHPFFETLVPLFYILLVNLTNPSKISRLVFSVDSYCIVAIDYEQLVLQYFNINYCHVFINCEVELGVTFIPSKPVDVNGLSVFEYDGVAVETIPFSDTEVSYQTW